MKKTFSLIFIFLITSFFFSKEQELVKSLPEQKNLLKTETFSTSKIRNLQINTTFENIKIIEQFIPEIKIEIYGNNNLLLPNIKIENSTLICQSTEKNITKGDNETIIFYIPQDSRFQTFQLQSKNKLKTNILLEGLKSDKIIIKTINSPITGKNLYGNLEISTSKSPVDLDKISSQKIKISTKTSKISIRNSLSSELYLFSQLGSIEIQNLTSEYILLKTTTGNIFCTNFAPSFFDIKTTKGLTTLYLSQPPEARSTIITESGPIQLYLPIKKDFSLQIQSTSGVISDKIHKKTIPPRIPFSKDFNKGGPELYIETTSGNIDLDKY